MMREDELNSLFTWNGKASVPRKPVAVVDVDGVTLDNTHRLHHIVHDVDGKQVQREDADWAAFHAAGKDDQPAAAAKFIKQLSHTHAVVFLTARVDFENQRKFLHHKLMNIMFPAKVIPLIMRERDPNWQDKKEGSNNAPESHVEYKRRAIRQLKAMGLDVQIGLDDSLHICKMFVEEGLLSLRVHNHVPEEALWR